MSDRIKQIDGLIKLLIAPPRKLASASVQASGNELGALLYGNVVCVKDKIHSDANFRWLEQSLSGAEQINGRDEDQCWQFVSFCLQLLLCLQSELKALKCHQESAKSHGTVPLDLLSIQQQRTVEALLQFITGIGISRNLFPGVGIRSQCFGLSLAHMGTQPDELSASDRNRMLLSTVTALLRSCEHSALGEIILTKCLSNLLAALCQLLFGPLKTNLDKELCSKMLDDVINRAYHPLVVRELLVLQGPKPSAGGKVAISPAWLRKATRSLFVNSLMTKQGVNAVIGAILDVGGADSSSYNWEKCDAIARLIASSVSEVPLAEEYFNVVSPQVLALLSGSSGERTEQFRRVGASTVMALYLSQPHLAEKYLIAPLTKVLHLCSNKAKGTDWCKPSEDEFSDCLSVVHSVFVMYTEPSCEFLKALSPVAPILLQLHAFVFEGVSLLRPLCIEVLCRYFKHVDHNEVLDSLSRFLFPFEERTLELPLWNSELYFSYGCCGGVVANLRNESQSQEAHTWLTSDSTNAASVLSLMSEFDKDRIVVRIFLYLLKSIPMNVPADTDEPSCADELNLMERKLHRDENGLRKSLIIYQLLSVLCEQLTLQEAMLSEKLEMIEFAKAVLERGTKCSTLQTGSETLTMALGVLSVLISDQEGCTAVLDALKSCLPALDELRHADNEMGSLASSLRMAILTSSGDQVAVNSDSISRPKKRESVGVALASSVEELVKSLSDPEPPVRGHALLSLSKLIQKKDEQALRMKQEILDAFQENLKDDDSYVYLMAVQGLSSFASVQPDSVLPCLLEEYIKVVKPELKMKLGEALVKTMQNLGSLVPKYREQFLNAYLNATKDPDPDICASALANLGEACQNLRFALWPCMHEIFDCVKCFIRPESPVIVRRAALNVLRQLLVGIGKDAFQLLETILKNIYRLLKHAYNGEKDDVAKLHAQIALEQLNIACREFIFPEQKLEKRIQILQAFVRSCAEFASSLWSLWLLGMIRQMESIQRRFTKRLPGMWALSYQERLARLKLETLEQLRLVRALVLLYKARRGWAYLPGIALAQAYHVMALWHHEDQLSIPQVRCQQALYSFHVFVLPVWNQLLAKWQNFDLYL